MFRDPNLTLLHYIVDQRVHNVTYKYCKKNLRYIAKRTPHNIALTYQSKGLPLGQDDIKQNKMEAYARINAISEVI